MTSRLWSELKKAVGLVVYTLVCQFSGVWSELKKAVGLVVYTLVCQFSGVGIYFVLTSNGIIENIVFG